MINIAICDDDKLMVAKIENMIIKLSNKYRIPVEVETYFDGRELEKDILRNVKYDLIYLDIQMSSLDGISTAQSIREHDSDVLIIFVSNYESYLKRLFELQAFRFLDKPIDDEIFEKYYLCAVKRIESNTVYFSFKFNRQVYKLRVNDIVYFESKKRSIFVHLSNGEVYSYYDKLDNIEENFSNSQIPFLRVHQSFLVNYKYIKEIDSTSLELLNNETLPISQFRQKEIVFQYSKFFSKELLDE